MKAEEAASADEGRFKFVSAEAEGSVTSRVCDDYQADEKTLSHHYPTNTTTTAAAGVTTSEAIGGDTDISSSANEVSCQNQKNGDVSKVRADVTTLVALEDRISAKISSSQNPKNAEISKVRAANVTTLVALEDRISAKISRRDPPRNGKISKDDGANVTTLVSLEDRISAKMSSSNPRNGKISKDRANATTTTLVDFEDRLSAKISRGSTDVDAAACADVAFLDSPKDLPSSLRGKIGVGVSVEDEIPTKNPPTASFPEAIDSSSSSKALVDTSKKPPTATIANIPPDFPHSVTEDDESQPTAGIDRDVENGTPGAHPVAGSSEELLPTTSRTDSSIRDTPYVAELVPPPAPDDIHHHHAAEGISDEVIEGTVVKHESERRRNRHRNKRFRIFVVSCAAVLVGLLVLFFSLQKKGGSEAESTIDTLSPNLTSSTETSSAAAMIYPPFTDDLPVSVLQAIAESNVDPISKANLWVLQDPHLDLYSQERLKQRFYLALLFFATNGKSWIHNDDWLSYNISECEWFSSSTYPTESPYFYPNICNKNGTLINLSLANNNLTGTLPIWYTPFMPLLRILDLGDNRIEGHFPVMTSTPYLEIWTFSKNPFTGIPRFNAGAMFPNLRVFHFDGMQYQGNNGGAFNYLIPKMELYNVTGHQNTKGGEIFTSFGLLTNLNYLGLGHMELSPSTIPTELGLLTNLKQLDLSSLPNVFGTIPSELGLLSELALFDLTNTPLTGTLPSLLCRRVENELLSIQANCSLLECC